MAAATSSTAPLPSIYHLSPPHGKITADDHGGYVVICGWIMMCFFTISVLTRLLTRFIPVTMGGIDDVLSGLSMLFGIAQTATIHLSATHGLGRHQRSLSPASFGTYLKSYYAANILYFLTICCAKSSLVFLVIRLSPARPIKRLCQGVLFLISLWTVGETFAFALQSSVPSVWDYTQSGGVSTPALYYTSAIGDIVTDLLVVALPAYVIWQVQIPVKKRVAVVAVFASRLVVIICSAIRISTLPNYVHSADRSWHAVGPQTWLQIIQCLSIITACIPCLKPLLESLESGFMDISIGKLRGETYGARFGGSGMHPTNSGNAKSSYMMRPFTSQTGNSQAVKQESSLVNVRSLQPSPHQDIQQGRYLDTQHGRKSSVAESERVLTSKSSDDDIVKADWQMSKSKLDRSVSGEGIRVTREVEVRDENVDSKHTMERRW